MFTANAQHYSYDEIEPTVEKLFRAFSAEGRTGSVLDVGCGNGLLAGALTDAGFAVTGVENHPSAIKTARDRGCDIIEADLTDLDTVRNTLAGRPIDYLLFADVLEHVADPLAVLRDYRTLLPENGRLVVSLPNVAVWDNRLRLMFGGFSYTDSGVMDRTHLRFFTFKTARQFIEAAGFQVEQLTLTPGIVRAFLPLIKKVMGGGTGKGGALMNSPAYRFYLNYILPPERVFASLLKGLFGFRIVIVARRATGD